MARGRKPKPTKLKIASGAYDKNPARFNGDEPDAPDGWPPKPADLDAVALAKWRETCGYMDRMGILSPAYATALECYAAAYSNYKTCLERVAKLGPVLVTQNNGRTEVRRNPFSVELHKYRDCLLKYESEFGLTPSSKSRLSVHERPSKSRIAGLIA